MVKQETPFNPILFLMSLGAGGLAIGTWFFLNVSLEHISGGKLISFSDVHSQITSLGELLFYSSIEVIAVLLVLLHLVTLIYLLIKFFKWKKTKNFIEFMNDPLKNSAIMAIFLTIDMTFNVAFALGNHFIFQNGPLFQLAMLPALLAWIVLFFFAMKTSMKILKTAFTQEFDMDKIHFGWMLHPFALAMISVTGMGIAVYAENFAVATTAFLLSLAPLVAAILLTLVKVVSMFQHHLKNNLPDRNFLPSTLIVMPVIMLIFMSFFRIGHYLNNQELAEIGSSYFIMTTALPFMFLLWYGIFGLHLISDYFKTFKEFNPTQWGFICPIAAVAVMGYFMNHTLLHSWMPLNYILLVIGLLGVTLYFNLLIKQIKALRA